MSPSANPPPPPHPPLPAIASPAVPAARPGPFVLRGALGFAAVSVAAFAVWAFGGRAFRGTGGEPVMYACIAAVFLLLTGAVLHPLVLGPNRVRRFYAAFLPAFLAYAVVWSGFWFWLKAGAGEWLGALVGSVAFVALIAGRLGRWPGFGQALAVFFVLHTAGYFAGGWSMGHLLDWARREPVPFADRATLVALAKLSWGLFYGLGFGAGLGFVLAVLQSPTRHRPASTASAP